MMALKLAAPPVEPPQGPPGLRIGLSAHPTSYPRDIPTLLQQEAERWIGEHQEIVNTAFSSLGISVDGKSLKVSLCGVDLPNADTLESFLRKGRIPAVSFVTADDGAFIITISSPDGHEVQCQCNVDISFPHKPLAASEASLVRQSLQMTLIKEANRTAAGLFEAHGMPAFAVWSDSDVQEITWSAIEQAQGFKVLRGEEAHTIYEALPGVLKGDSTAVAPSALLLLTANKRASDEYRDALLSVVQELLGGPNNALQRGIFRHLKQSPDQDPLTASLFTLISSALVEQDGRDSAGIAYQKRFGIEPDAVREKLKSDAEAARKRSDDIRKGPAAKVRETFVAYLGDTSPCPELRGVLASLQSAVLFALKQQNPSKATAAIDEILPQLPAGLKQELEQLKATIEG